MILFFTKPGESGEQIQQEINIDALEVISKKYIISIRTSGIHIKNRETNLPVDLSQDNIIFDTNLDLS